MTYHHSHCHAALQDLCQADICQLGMLHAAVKQHICRLHVKADHLHNQETLPLTENFRTETGLRPYQYDDLNW